MATLPERYETVSKEILSDIFYLKGLSNRGRMTLIRQYTEILCRILLGINDHFLLGKFDERLDKQIPDAIFPERIKSHVNYLKDLGNDATHLDVKLKEIITSKDCENALNSLNFLISYLFINYFNKHEAGSRPEPLFIISLLPPFIRVTIWENLYEHDKNNIAVIDKLFLALLKSEGKKVATNWLEQEKEHLLNLECIEKDALESYRLQEYLEYVIQLIVNDEPNNMYELCVDKLEKIEQQYPNLNFPYSTFEEAKAAYLSEIRKYQQNSDEAINELIELMDFIYIGRSTSNAI